MTNLEVMEAFLHQRNAKSLNMTSINGRLFSYGTVIAQYGYGHIVVNDTKYSHTTSKQLSQFKNLLQRLVERNGQVVKSVKGIRIGTRSIVSDGVEW